MQPSRNRPPRPRHKLACAICRGEGHFRIVVEQVTVANASIGGVTTWTKCPACNGRASFTLAELVRVIAPRVVDEDRVRYAARCLLMNRPIGWRSAELVLERLHASGLLPVGAS